MLNTQKSDIKRWQARKVSKATADTAIAGMLVELAARAKAAGGAWHDRLVAMFSRADYDRLFDCWESGHDAPPDLGARLAADSELQRAGREYDRLLWLLLAVQRGGVVSEHYVYSQCGRLVGPNGET